MPQSEFGWLRWQPEWPKLWTAGQLERRRCTQPKPQDGVRVFLILAIVQVCMHSPSHGCCSYRIVTTQIGDAYPSLKTPHGVVLLTESPCVCGPPPFYDEVHLRSDGAW